jgi:arabinose-5-phosphate isomerase
MSSTTSNNVESKGTQPKTQEEKKETKGTGEDLVSKYAAIDRLRKCFTSQQQLINKFFAEVNLEDIHKVVTKLLETRGCCFLTGVGKSGIVAEKIAQTFVSTGTKAAYLSCQNALHGDISIMEPGDLFICFSKSGGSTELLTLIPFVKARQVYTIAVTSTPTSKLAELCDMHVCLPLERELCPFNMSPTTSCILQTIFGDTVTVAVMNERKFDITQYAKNHPSGRIGMRLTYRVADLMQKPPPVCNDTDNLLTALLALTSGGSGCVCVVNSDGELMGIFTDGDLRRFLVRAAEHQAPMQARIDGLMTPRHKLKFTKPDVMAHDAVTLAQKPHFFNVVPVIDSSDKLVGLFRMQDVIRVGL